ncbi:MAG: hypothetical protein QGD92_15390 [Gammaproteobacteria bacterium]|nr:hypothetical protein [Gammaproteobacteria bacterium]
MNRGCGRQTILHGEEYFKPFGLKHYGGESNASHMQKQEVEVDARINRLVNGIINRFDP